MYLCEIDKLGFVYHSSCNKVKVSDQLILITRLPIASLQCSISRLRETGNITEAPPVADKARRCWRKTRSIAPAPRAIGDYVLRGLNGLRSKTHEPVLFERSEFTGECAEQLNESRGLCAAARRSRGLGAKPIKRQAHIGFAQQNCLHLKVLDF